MKLKGQDIYLYRAIDKEGNTIDVKMSKTSDKQAAFNFVCKAIGSNGIIPEKVTIDRSKAN